MEIQPIKTLNKKEIMRYLGYYKNENLFSAQIENQIIICEKKVLQNMACRAVCSEVIPITVCKQSIKLQNTDVEFAGSDIMLHLKGCYGVILLAVTIGQQIDAVLRTAEAGKDMLQTIILDCCASVATEQAAQNAEQAILENTKKSGKFITPRYSPGYGDFDINIQSDFIRLLDAQRKIGLAVTRNGILTPRKSITAVIGIADMPVSGCLAGCKTCKLKDKCEYKKRGQHCEN